MSKQANAATGRPTSLRWLLAVGALALLLLGLWWVERRGSPAPAHDALDESPSHRSRSFAAPSPASPTVPTLPRIAAPPSAVDPCTGLQLLDIETATDGRVAGVWLRNDTVGPSLVRTGERLGPSKLVRAEGVGRQSAQLWFEHAATPCSLTLVPAVDLAKAVAGAAPGARYERDTTEQHGYALKSTRQGAAAVFSTRRGPVAPGGTLMRATIDAQPAL